MYYRAKSKKENLKEVINLKYLAGKMEKSNKPISTLEIVDHAIVIQLTKLEKQTTNPMSKSNDEETMKNLIDLLKLRNELIN